MHYLTTKEFEQAFAFVEGEEHLQRSLAGMMGQNSISYVREMLLGGQWPHVIYGNGGWNRYCVRPTGEVVFHKGAGETMGQTEIAFQAGFRIC